MKKILSVLSLLLALAALLCSCSKERIVHCDRCGQEIVLDAGSNIEEDWIVFCRDCEEPVVS